MTTREYKSLKNLKKESLRDNMTNMELVLNMLAEASVTEISKVKKPCGLSENKKIAKAGGEVAKKARQQLEFTTKKPLITQKNATQLSLNKKSEN